MSELRRFNGYNPTPETIREQLPVGGYIARIQFVKVETRPDNSQRLIFRTEIIEGPYADFFHRDYNAQRGGAYEAKYRGDYSILCPDEKGSDPKLVDWFNHTMGAIEDSNPGYKWDWNTSSLQGRIVGLSVREAEYQQSVYTEIGKFIPVSVVREGRFRPMKRREERKNNPAPSPQPFIPQQPSSPVPPVPVANYAGMQNAPSTSPLPFNYQNDDDIPF